MVLKTERTITMLTGHDEVASRLNRMQVIKAIERGKTLLTLKDRVPRKEWDAFLEENVRYSKAACDVFMKLAREEIHENLYKHGVHALLRFIDKQYDLSREFLNPVLSDDEWAELSAYA